MGILMREELQDLLRAKYPRLLRDIYIECGDGWYDILDCLCKEIECVICKMPDEDSSPLDTVYAVQIKEKFASLRFYMTIQTDTISSLINFASLLSEITCEVCGDRGEVIRGALHKVRCKDCINKTRHDWL